MSVSRKFLLKSAMGIVLFKGEIKQDAYMKFLTDSVSYEQCPAKLISMIPNSFMVTDLENEKDLLEYKRS
jgi:hypothetical protein